MFSSPRTRSNLRVFGGSSHPELTKLVARKVGVRIGEVDLKQFANRETNVALRENVRGQDIYVLQTGGSDRPNDHLMELFFMINAFKLSAAGEITVITPFYPYSKGDQKDGSRVPISSKLVADLLKRAGASYIMMLDPHTPQLEGFFDTPVDALKVEPLFCEWIKHNVPNWHDAVVVSPDEGAVKKSVSVANDLNLDFALIHNRCKIKGAPRSSRFSTRNVPKFNDFPQEGSTLHPEAGPQSDSYHRTRYPSSTRNDSSTGSLSGSVEGRTVVMIDDMIDTGKTLKFAAEVIEREGAKDLYFMATHGLFSGKCVHVINHLKEGFLKGMVVTNSIPQDARKDALNNFSVIDVSGLIAEFIRRHHYKESVSVLSQFMPIRDEAPRRKKSAQQAQERLAQMNLNARSNAQEEGGGAAAAGEPGHAPSEADALDSGDDEEGDEEETDVIRPAQDKNMQRLRKGFRLSSVCWDD